MTPIMNQILNNGSTEKRLYWDIKLDQDLLETIVNIYPEWFKENTFTTMTDESDPMFVPFSEPMEADAGSPPVDNRSLKNTMDKNKESLKVKLMLRRPINQLIDQGILPPLRTSAGFHQQKQKLERAKTGDLLKHKIQRRPQRQELIEQHILEDTTVDPSLHEKQRQLKKARLADDLNDRLSHRPGPLELIKGNILHTVEPFEQAVKEGQIPFKKTSEGEAIKHPPPRFIFANEEESSSDSASSPLINTPDQSLSGLITFDAPNDASNATTLVASLASSEPSTTVSYIVSSPVTSLLTSPSTVHSILIGNGNALAIAAPNTTSSVVAVASNATAPIISGTAFNQTSNSISINSPVVSNFKEHSSSSKYRKKSKSKAQPKARTIKFHEYKGPPDAKNQPNSSLSATESSYELLLQQQQLFLQWQLEWQQKYPQIILPTAQTISDQSQEQGSDAQAANQAIQKASGSNVSKNPFQPKAINQSATNNESNSSVGSPRDRSNSNASTTNSKFNPSVVGKIISKLEDMKVSDLKAELKKRNLPVSGAKQQLIDRLKPFADAVVANALANSSLFSTISTNSDESEHKINTNGTKIEVSIDSMVMSPALDSSNNDVKSEQNSDDSTAMEVDIINEDVDQKVSLDLNNETASQNANQNSEEIVLLQQQRISELQRELQKSQMQLQLQHTTVLPIESQTVAIPLSQAVNAPQIHIISTPNGEPLSDSSSQKSLQRQLLQQHLQQKLQQNSLNVRPQPTATNETNLATLLTNATISPSVKASLAAFLQQQQLQQQQQQQQQQSQQGQTLTTKLLANQTLNPIQQFVLCPSVCTTAEVNGTEPESCKQRTNSLPNGLCHRTTSQSSQRTSSLPNFNTLVNQSTDSVESSDVKPRLIISRCPPNYDEATKQVKTKDKKNSIKSQAVDDVLEILIKNGELPPSAAHDPTTPTTPEKLLALNGQSNPLFKKGENSLNSRKSKTLDNSNSNHNLKNERKPNESNNNNSNNNLNIININNEINNKTNAQNNVTLDFDFILDLEGLAEAMDLNVAINEKALKTEKSSVDGLKKSLNNDNIDNSIANQTINRTPNKNTNNNDISLTEFMDFQDCNLNVEDNHWMDMASTSMASNEQNLINYEESRNQNSQNVSFDSNNNSNMSDSVVSPSAVKSENSKHDPILPNTMFGGNLIDPLGDLFFDDTDFKSSLDFGALMWDKVDFAT